MEYKDYYGVDCSSLSEKMLFLLDMDGKYTRKISFLTALLNFLKRLRKRVADMCL